MEVAVKGAQAIYALALVVCFYLGGKVLPPAFDAVDKLTAAMKDSAAALAKVSADVADARAGVGRVEEAQARLDKRLGAIEADISELRKDLRRDLPRK
jgi:septal ring factor EnvC (AmiA/AmiB activator)